MQSKNKIKSSLKNLYSHLGEKNTNSIVCGFCFYKIKVPPLLLEKDETSIDTQNSSIQ